jgi:rhamnosyl/mannosyltransferase
MSRILVLGKFYAPFNGGIERYTTALCERLARDHDVTAVVFDHQRGGSEEVRGGVRVHRLPARYRVGGQPLSARLFGAFDLSEYNLVHFHAPNPLACVALLGELARHASPPPLVITHHMDMHAAGPLKWGAQLAYGRLLDLADTVVVSSRKNVAVSGDLKPGLNYVEIPFGVAVSDYALSPGERLDALRWRRSKVGWARTVGFVGRHARYKGLDVLVRALAAAPGVHAFIAGDGPYRAPAESLARALGVGDRAHFLGEVSEADKRRVFAASDAFVLPSTEITEAFGITQLEAMAAGLPVIASDLPTGVTDVTVHGVSGLLCAPGDPQSLAAAIARLTSDESLRRTLAAGARRHVAQGFDDEVVMARTVVALEGALYGFRRGAARASPGGGWRPQHLVQQA